MQLRVRHPAGQAVLTLDDSTATVAILFTSIAQTCALDVSCISLMSGFPPAPLNVAHDSSASLKDIGLQSGDTLIVKAKQADVNVTPTPVGVGGAATDVSQMSEDEQLAHAIAMSERDAGLGVAPSSSAATPAPSSVCVRRVVDSDNSCLFRAVGYVMHGSRAHADRLRRECADAVSADPVRFNEAILGASNAEYRAYLLNKDKWGGAIELMILSEVYKREIAAYDIVTQRRDLYGEGNGYSERVMVIYDGIHYDALAMAPRRNAPETNDVTVFRSDGGDAAAYDASARELVREANRTRQFTDTANFTLRCLVCQKGIVGEKEAREHAKTTGHQNFGEYA